MVVLRGRVLFHSGKGAYASQYHHLQSKHLVQAGNSIRILTNGVKLGQTPHRGGAQKGHINRLKQGDCLLFWHPTKSRKLHICPCAHRLSQFLCTLSTVLRHVTFRSPLGKHSPGPGQLNGSLSETIHDVLFVNGSKENESLEGQCSSVITELWSNRIYGLSKDRMLTPLISPAMARTCSEMRCVK